MLFNAVATILTPVGVDLFLALYFMLTLDPGILPLVEYIQHESGLLLWGLPGVDGWVVNFAIFTFFPEFA